MNLIVKGPEFLESCDKFKDEETGLTLYINKQWGFYTDEKLVLDSEMVETQVKPHFSQLSQQLMVRDEERGLLWVPVIVNSEFAILFPDGTSNTDWKWCIGKYIDLTPEEQKKYPIPEKEGEFYGRVLDVENIISFEPNDYESATETMRQIVANGIAARG